jgi:hypothetical protein
MPAEKLLIPVRRFSRHSGTYPLPGSITLSCPDAGAAEVQQLAADLGAYGVKLRVAGANAADWRLEKRSSLPGPESYRLTIKPRGLVLSGGGAAGIYYGVQTLRELLRSSALGESGRAGERESGSRPSPRSPAPPLSRSPAPGLTLPACRIDDRPDFARRGVSLDCSRGKVPTLARLKDLVELLAHWKINELQLYIENVFRFHSHPEIGRGYSPFSADDIRRLQEHCRRHHVRLVGSLASFGHMEKILQIPRYRPLGEMPGYRGWSGGTTLCPHDPGSIRLLEELYGEFLPLFDAEYFNVNGDEPWELGQGRSVLRARWLGIGRIYADFLSRIDAVCRRHGKRMNVWADIVLQHPAVFKHLPKDVVMLNWDYDADGPNIPRTREIVRRGLSTVVCPGTHGWLSHGCRLIMGMQNIARFAAEGLTCGADGLLNTDWGDNGHRNMLAVSLHNLAWGAAHAWHHAGTRPVGFTRRFCRQTFGIADPDFASAIRTLGTPVEPKPRKFWSSFFLYSSLLPSIQAGFDYREMGIDALPYVPDEALRRQESCLAELRWPDAARFGAGTPVRPKFLSQMLEEYALAARLDRLSCGHCLAMKQQQEGKRIPISRQRSLIDQAQAASDELRRVWLLGNRPSRLKEHLAGFKQLIRESGA